MGKKRSFEPIADFRLQIGEKTPWRHAVALSIGILSAFHAWQFQADNFV
jgi:hypothetical protein